MRRDSENACDGASFGAEEICRKRGRVLPQQWLFASYINEVWPPPRVPAKEVEARTGALDRSCRSWVSGEYEPDSWVLAAVLAGDDGEQLLKVMFGRTPPAWWRSLQRAKRIVEAIDNVRAASRD